MTTKRPQNSILVLATLGVYLGLVLAGATPQVLANAAMTRQFDVKDEIEYKEDLDTKPDRTVAEFSANEADENVTRAIETFLAKFTPVISLDASFHNDDSSVRDLATLNWQKPKVEPHFPSHSQPISRIISVNNLARADLDALLANDAK